MSQQAQRRLAGKVFIVVGGTSGLGLSASRAVMREGGRVVVIGRDPAKMDALKDGLDDVLRGICGDARDSMTAERAVEMALATWNQVDGLYHVAGGSGRRWGDGPLDSITDEGWAQTLDWNLTSVFYSNRAVLRALKQAGKGGSIVNCGSVLGFSPSPTHFSTHTYAAAKAGIIGLTRACAAHYAQSNVRFNVLAPALVATPMSARAQESEVIQKFIQSKQPLDGGRMGVPEDLDGALIWLLSDESRYVTGQVISVDGGWTVTG